VRVVISEIKLVEIVLSISASCGDIVAMSHSTNRCRTREALGKPCSTPACLPTHFIETIFVLPPQLLLRG